jgi:TonB family protein
MVVDGPLAQLPDKKADMLNGQPTPVNKANGTQSTHPDKQPRRMLAALILLLVALGVLLVRDRQFWFGAGENSSVDSEAVEEAEQESAATTATSTPAPSLPEMKPKNHAVTKTPSVPQAEAPAVVATNRTVLPPLEVEVISGDKHRTVQPGSNAVKVEVGSGSASAVAAPATNAAERVRISPVTAAVLQQPDLSSYPMLAQQMRVQGSVVLQALIGADGAIQDIRVVSGPSILASAAQEAVRQWRFKPYMQDGRPVETKANITVNFTIKVLDNATRTS